MAVERKMGAKRLMDFSPGQEAVTLLDAVAPEEAPVGCKGEAPPQQIVEAPSRQGTPGLKGVIVYLAQAKAIALKVYAAQHSTSIQQLGAEAFSELFRKLGINGGVLSRVRTDRKNGVNR